MLESHVTKHINAHFFWAAPSELKFALFCKELPCNFPCVHVNIAELLFSLSRYTYLLSFPLGSSPPPILFSHMLHSFCIMKFCLSVGAISLGEKRGKWKNNKKRDVCVYIQASLLFLTPAKEFVTAFKLQHKSSSALPFPTTRMCISLRWCSHLRDMHMVAIGAGALPLCKFYTPMLTVPF